MLEKASIKKVSDRVSTFLDNPSELEDEEQFVTFRDSLQELITRLYAHSAKNLTL